MADLQCPLDPHAIPMFQFNTRMNLARVKEIEHHVSSAGPCIHPPLADLLLHGTRNKTSVDTTPLLVACEEGHLDAVIRIVQVWRADVNAAATYYFGGFSYPKIEKATPLFVATLRGHTDIVRFLIGHGADVFLTTSTQDNPEYDGLTALQGALMETGLSFSEEKNESNTIVGLLLEAGADPNTRASDGTPVWMRKFCDDQATIALVNHGLNVNQPNREGETILHHWTQLPSFRRSTGRVTVSSNATRNEAHYSGNRFVNQQAPRNQSINLIRSIGIAPAREFKKPTSLIPVLIEEREVVVQLLLDSGANLMARDNKGFTPILTSAKFNQFGILNMLLQRDDIDRNEKIDALELAGARLLSGLIPNSKRAYAYWIKALRLRQSEEPNPINKIPLQKTSRYAIEWVTLDELEDVIQDPAQYYIQAMVTQLRVYSYRSCKAVRNFIESKFSHGFFKSSYGYYGAVVKSSRVTHIQDLLLEILGVFLHFGPYEPMLWIHTRNLVRELTGSFITPENGKPLTDVKLQRITTSLQLILEADPEGRIELQYGFFAMLAKLPDGLKNKDIRKYASPSARLHAGILLHRACNMGDWKTLRLLLHLGADPNSSYCSGNKPLHIVAGQKEDSPANLLFEYGAQPYAINGEGKTAVQLWMEKNCGGEDMQSSAWNRRPLWCRDTVPKLSGLVAKTIHIQGISCSHPRALPNALLKFLDNH